jgi:hypothetical protein
MKAGTVGGGVGSNRTRVASEPGPDIGEDMETNPSFEASPVVRRASA